MGETLTASASAIADADGLTRVSYNYQWVANNGNADTALQSATDSAYTPSINDVGKTIKVTVSFTDDANNSESLTSVATAPVAATVPTAPSRLTVARGSQIQELDASWQSPSSNGGSAVTGYKVQWKDAADSWDAAVDVSEATVTGTTHAITGLTGGVEYAVRVIATNLAGDGPPSTEATATPAGSSSEQNNEPDQQCGQRDCPPSAALPRLSRRLRPIHPASSDEDGLSNVSYSYQWIAGGVDIDGATGSTYTLTYSQQGQTIQVRLSFTDDANHQESLTSEATVAVTPAPNRDATGAPTISGTPQVNQTLTADTSAISDADGLNNVSYNYQWLADGSDINGATGSTLHLTSNQLGQTIQIRITFEDDAGNTETITSAATVAVTAEPTPLTASFSNVPASHIGSGEFTFDLSFSENVKAGYERVRDDAFTIVGGDILKAQRREQGTNQYWTITVKPDGNGAVYITLPETTDCNATGAICTDDERKLSNSTPASIAGPQ